MKSHEWKKEISRSLTNTAQAISALAELRSFERFESVIVSILHAQGNIIVTGAGTSGVAARKVVHTFRCQEIPAYFLSPIDALHGASGSIQSGDMLIGISNGGATKAVNDIVTIAKGRGAVIIGVTADLSSELAELSDTVLHISVEQESDASNLLATASISCIIAAFDAIGSVIMKEKHFSPDSFAQIHPEGKVGEMLKKPKN